MCVCVRVCVRAHACMHVCVCVCVCTCVSDSTVMRLGCCNQWPFSQVPLCVAVMCVCGANDVVETHCYVFWIAMDERADLRVK